MKKYLAIIAAFSLALTGCGKSGEKNSDDDAITSSPDESIEDVATDGLNNETLNIEPDTEENEKTYNWSGIMMPIPDGFVINTDGFSIDEDDMYKSEVSGNTVYYGVNARYYYENEAEYSVSDVPELMKGKLNDLLEINMKSDETQLADNKIKEETVSFLGESAIHKTGVLNTSYFGEEEHTVSYSAYYAIVDFPEESERTPAMWICYAEGEGDKLMSELEKISALPLAEAYAAKDTEE